MSKKNKFCQSCGMPMKQDPQGGGTNTDGSINENYCSYCYQNGEFTFNGTVKEFQEFCRQKMLEGGHSKFLAWLFTRGMKRLERWKNMPKTILILSFVIICLSSIKDAKAQRDIREHFLVDKIHYIRSYDNALSKFTYDADNKLIKVVTTGQIPEAGQMINIHLENIYEYENGRVSKIFNYDYTHYMFDSEVHLFYNEQGQLIRKENQKDGYLINYSDFYYKNGYVDSISYTDSYWQTGTVYVYDDAMNVIKGIETIPKCDIWGDPIPGEYVVREKDYEYDNNPRPNFGIDHLFVHQPLMGLGNVALCERFLSKNNMTKAIFESESYIYTYNEYRLPEAYQVIWEGMEPPDEEAIFIITYKQIKEIGISEPTQDFSKINIFPNPAKDNFFIECENYCTITLYDLLGKEILTQNLNGKTEININHLPKGIYNITVFSESKIIENSKIVKQ